MRKLTRNPKANAILFPEPPTSEAQYLCGIPIAYVRNVGSALGVTVKGVHVWLIPSGDIKPGHMVAPRDPEKAPADVYRLTSSQPIFAPVYDFIEKFVVRNEDGLPTPKRIRQKFIDDFASQTLDWLSNVLQDEDVEYRELLERADLATVGKLMMYCVSFFYDVPVDALGYTVDEYKYQTDSTIIDVMEAVLHEDVEEEMKGTPES